MYQRGGIYSYVGLFDLLRSSLEDHRKYICGRSFGAVHILLSGYLDDDLKLGEILLSSAWKHEQITRGGLGLHPR